jgi:hypothetical protein
MHIKAHPDKPVLSFLARGYELFLSLNASFPPDEIFLSEPLFCQMLFTGLGESFDPVLFGLSRTLNKASDWTYEVIFNAIQKETDRQGSTEWGTTALNTSSTGSSSRGGGQKGRSRGGKPRSVEAQEKPKGEKGEKETVVAKDGSRWTKGDMWCEFHGANNANHSTKGCIAAARENQRKERGHRPTSPPSILSTTSTATETKSFLRPLTSNLPSVVPEPSTSSSSRRPPPPSLPLLFSPTETTSLFSTRARPTPSSTTSPSSTCWSLVVGG